MSGGAAAWMAWTPMCGQGWIEAAASFLAMWTVMMAVMMLPSFVPALWRYRSALGRAEAAPAVLSSIALAGGYVLVWTLLGAAVYPLGVAMMAVVARFPVPTRVLPIATGLVVLSAGALQLTSWKARQLVCCRGAWWRESSGCERPPSAGIFTAGRHGVRLGLHCTRCCAGLTAALLVTGIMSWPAMLVTTAAVNLERLLPGGARIARAVGVVLIGAGLSLTVRAVALP
jgi:predicted metal-binding membrane protein